MKNSGWLVGLCLLTLGAAQAGAGEVVMSVDGFAGPEAVRYDPAQDVYFVANFNGDTRDDANGFISKVSPRGEILALRFMEGTATAPFHAGRGMWLRGEHLWVADAYGVHAFDRRSGAHVRFVSLAAFDPGFPNDIAAGPDGALYVTDTGRQVLYRIADGEATVAVSTPFAANGIARVPDVEHLLLAPWSGSDALMAWSIGTDTFKSVAPLVGGGNFDGVEWVGGVTYVASQQDQSLHVITGGKDGQRIALAGKPADLGVDTKRQRLIVPYVALDRIDIIALDP